MAWKIQARLGLLRSLELTQYASMFTEHDGNWHYTPEKFKELFPTLRPPQYLRISNSTLKDWRPLLVAPDCPFTLTLQKPITPTAVPIRIVYFINCHINPNYAFMLCAQLKALRKTALLQRERCSLYVVSSGTEKHYSEVQLALYEIFGKLPNVYQKHFSMDKYEYPGIYTVWQLGQESQEGYIIYFHARGLSRMKLGKFRRRRQWQEKRLFDRVIGEWRQNLTWLEHIPHAAKLGLNSIGGSWIWYNFWWARASYIACVEEPAITERRHYYEDWLGRIVQAKNADFSSNNTRCINLATSHFFKKFHLGSDFNPHRGETRLGLPWGFCKAILIAAIIRLGFFKERWHQ